MNVEKIIAIMKAWEETDRHCVDELSYKGCAKEILASLENSSDN